MTKATLVQELRHHAKMAWLIKYKSHPCWKAADAIEALTAALQALLDCPAIDDDDSEWSDLGTAEAVLTARAALQAEDLWNKRPSGKGDGKQH